MLVNHKIPKIDGDEFQARTIAAMQRNVLEAAGVSSKTAQSGIVEVGVESTLNIYILPILAWCSLVLAATADLQPCHCFFPFYRCFHRFQHVTALPRDAEQ